MKHRYNEIFQKMRRLKDNGTNFEGQIVHDWYIARRYVLDNINKWTGERIGSRSSNSLKIVLSDNSPLTYSIIRHIALFAHFPNFEEETRNNITTITILYPPEFSIKDLENEVSILSKEEYLFNLIGHSFYKLTDAQGNSKVNPSWLPFLDIEFMLLATADYQLKDGEVFLSADEIRSVGNNTTNLTLTDKELTAAMLVNQAYSAGVEISNLSSTENEKASRYCIALDCLNKTKRKNARKNWDELFLQNEHDKNLLKHKAMTNILSCIFCADTFESRLYQLMNVPEKITHKFLILNANHIRRQIANNLLALSKSEHARWNTEKLILGFRPLSREESFIDETKIGKRESYRRELKNRFPAPSHIDILSFSDLKRVNPEDLKYDSFIMLAIPTILRRKYRPQINTKSYINRLIRRNKTTNLISNSKKSMNNSHIWL